MFPKREIPLMGRYRRFNQFRCRCARLGFSRNGCGSDSLADGFIRSLGITDVTLSINSVGCPTCRSAYYEKLKEFLKDKVDLLCDDCKGRYEKNPMRIIDCKNESCKAVIRGVPLMLDNLCEECADHFEGVKGYLNAAEIPYVMTEYREGTGLLHQYGIRIRNDTAGSAGDCLRRRQI
jgi:histidyl-tRNA synthetase